MNVRIQSTLFILSTIVLLPLSQVSAQSIHKPSGIFASSGWRDRNALNSDIAKGILVRVRWNSIEPQPGKFDLSSIDQQKNAITHAGKQWTLAVIAGGNSPSWLMEKPFDTKTLSIKARTRSKGYVPVDMPCYWDQTVQDRLKKLAQALAEKYNDDPTLVLVYVPQMTSNGIEGHFNANRPADLRQAGLTGEKYITAAKSAAQSFAMAFTHKAIAIEVHEILDDASIPEKIITDLWNDPTLNHRVGAGMWWLSGKNNYQANLLKVLKTYPGDIYAQVIGRSDQTHRFPNGDYASIFTQAKTLGIRYIEVWEYELKHDRFTAAFKRFTEHAN